MEGANGWYLLKKYPYSNIARKITNTIAKVLNFVLRRKMEPAQEIKINIGKIRFFREINLSLL